MNQRIDYKTLSEEQARMLRVLGKRCKDKEHEITRLNQEIRHLRNLLKKQ